MDFVVRTSGLSPVETLSSISDFHIVFRVKCSISFLSECLEISLVSDELLDILKGLDGEAWWMIGERREKNIAHFSYLHFILLIENCLFYIIEQIKTLSAAFS